MKKWIFLTTMVLLPFSTKAQSKFANGMAVGYANMKTEMFTPSFQNTTSTGGHGFYADYFLERRFAERFASNLRVGYINTTSTFASETSMAQMKINQGMINMALGLKFFPIYNLSVLAGVYGNTDVHHSIKGSSEILGTEPLKNLTEKVKSEYEDLKRYDYGIRFGADYRIWEDLHIEGFYHLSLNKKTETYNRQGVATSQYKVNTFGAGMSYRF